VFPDIRIAMTEPGSAKRFRRDPEYFLRAAQRSRCLLFVASKNSIGRPMVEIELSHNPAKPIVTVATDGDALAAVDARTRRSPFIRLDRDRIVDIRKPGGWLELAGMVGRELRRPLPDRLPSYPTLDITVDDREKSRLIERYIRDWGDIVRAGKKAQSREAATDAVDNTIRYFVERGVLDQATLEVELEPEGKLVAILDVCPEVLVPSMLERVPSLVTDVVVIFAETVAKHCEANEEFVDAARMRRIARQVEAWIRANRGAG
jgi:hypothetical protein